MQAWLRTAIVGLAAIGVAISIYLTVAHYQRSPLACPANGVVDCGAVTGSAFSTVPYTSIPISVLGLAWFAISAGLVLPRASAHTFRLLVAHFAWSVLGLGYVLYLVYLELVVIHRICEWCSAVHLAVLATFLVSLRRLQTAPAA